MLLYMINTVDVNPPDS